MSMAEFLQQLDDKRFSKNEQKWFPKWLAGYVQHHHLNQNHIPIKTSLVLSFLQSLRDANIPPWRRLQAAQALSSYQRHVLAKQDVNFQTFINKLTQLSRLDDQQDLELDEQVPHTPPSNLRDNPPPHAIVVPGEGHPGLVDQKQPQVIQQMTRTLRMLHHPKSTEVAYLGWIRRFIRHLDDENIQRYGEPEIGEFLTDLAVTQHVTAGTQNQALAACLFLYQKVLGRDLRFIHTVRAKSSQYRPVVLTKREVNEILSRLTGRNRMMFLLMYGSGLRHRECRTLRCKDICFESGQIVVRNGKGMKDRVTVLADCVIDELKQQNEAVRCLHQEDIDHGFGRVYLPFALARKYPNADRDLGWQYVFPSRQLSKVPGTVTPQPMSLISYGVTLGLDSRLGEFQQPAMGNRHPRLCTLRCRSVNNFISRDLAATTVHQKICHEQSSIQRKTAPVGKRSWINTTASAQMRRRYEKSPASQSPRDGDNWKTGP